MPVKDSSRASTGFIYTLGLIVSIFVSLTCIVTLMPLAVYLIMSPANVDKLAADSYIDAVNKWNDEKRSMLKQAKGFNLTMDGQTYPLIEKTDAFSLPEEDIKRFQIPSYQGLYYKAENLQFYQNLKYPADDDARVQLEFSNGNKPDDSFAVTPPVFKKDTRRVQADADCLGELVGRECTSVWRLTGFCLLVTTDGNEEGSFLEGKESGCTAGESGQWESAIHGEQVVPNGDRTYSLKASVVLRSTADPYVSADYLTFGSMTFIEKNSSKMVLGIILLVCSGLLALTCCLLTCGGTMFFIHAKRMEKEYKYQEIATNEVEPLFSDTPDKNAEDAPDLLDNETSGDETE